MAYHPLSASAAYRPHRQTAALPYQSPVESLAIAALRSCLTGEGRRSDDGVCALSK